MTDTQPPARERLAVLADSGAELFVDAVRDGFEVVGESRLPGSARLTFTASDVRQERTGVHARLRIGIAGGVDQMLAYTVCNVDRDEDRVRLANSAAKRLGADKGRGEQIKARLDVFCAQLWDVWTRSDEGQWVEPDEDGSAPSWLLEPYLLRDGGTILYGREGAGKSWITQLWTVGLTYGALTQWHHERVPVLFINLERSAKSIRWRTARVCRALGLDRPLPLMLISRRGHTLWDVWDAARRTVDTHQIELVVVDSLSRIGAGDLNANEAANRAMDALNKLAPAWLALAHTSKADDRSIYGSVMHAAAADLCVSLRSAEDPDDPDRLGVQLEVTKANDVRKAKATVWALTFDHGGLRSIGPAAEGEFPDLDPVRSSVTDQVVAALEELGGKATVTELADHTGLDRRRCGEICKGRRFVCIEEGRRGGPPGIYGLRAAIREPGA